MAKKNAHIAAYVVGAGVIGVGLYFLLRKPAASTSTSTGTNANTSASLLPPSVDPCTNAAAASVSGNLANYQHWADLCRQAGGTPALFL
jgi:hypothetical protein